MAYPVISAPYGMIQSQGFGNDNFAGVIRAFPIPYGYATDIFSGDAVGLSRGRLARLSITTGTAGNVTGVFVGCSYTDPVTKQFRNANYWPASTLAGDGVAYVVTDPNVIFKIAVCSATTVIASAAAAMVGQNLAMINNTGSTITGRSANAALAPTDTPATTSTLPLRVVGLVEETKVILGTATYSSINTATVTTAAGIPAALPVGTDVYSVASNGQMISSGSFVDTAAAAGATTVILNQAPVAAFGASATLVFVQYPEIYVKWNFGQSQYQAGTSIA